MPQKQLDHRIMSMVPVLEHMPRVVEKKLKFVVTGAAGFIGSTLVKRLIADYPEAKVVGIDCLTDYYSREQKQANLESITSPAFSFVQEDLNRVNLEVLDEATAIFHQAGQPGVRSSWGQEFTIHTQMNVNATQRLLEYARTIGSLERFVYASSSSVYGDADSYPTHETNLPKPKSPYGVTKLAAEHLVSLYAENFGLPTISLRYFTVYGPGQRPDMAFHKFLRAAIMENDIEVYGDGEQLREFTHVNDIVAANICAWREETKAGEVINLSGGSSVSVNEAIETIREISGKNVRVRYLESATGDVRRTGGSTAKASSLLNWAPQVKFKDGLQSEFHWMLANLERENAELQGATR